MAIVAEGARGRVYLAPTAEMEAIAAKAEPTWKPDVEFFQQALGFRVGNYGMTKWSDLFTPRQLVALTTFSDLVAEAREQNLAMMLSRPALPTTARASKLAGAGATAYAEAVSVYLAFAVDKSADRLSSTLSVAWETDQGRKSRHLFARQAIPMAWDYR